MKELRIVQLTPEDLAAMIKAEVREALSEHEQRKSKQPKVIREKITPAEAAELAGRSKQTILNRAKEGLLTKYPGKGKLFYVSRTEVLDMFCRPSSSV